MIVSVLLTALGFAGWSGMTFYGESAAAIFVLMAIAVAHSVHIIEAVLAGLREGMDRKRAAAHSMQLNMWPVFLTSVTTSIGFLSLNFSEMPPFQVMGNLVAFGSLFAFVYAVTLLPAVLSYMPMRTRPPREGSTDRFDWLGRFVVSHRVVLLCSFGVLIVALVAGVFRVELKENWLELLGESYEFRQSTDFISENYTGVEAFEYALSAGREGGVTGCRVPAQGRRLRRMVPGPAEGGACLRHLRHHEAPEHQSERRRSGLLPRPGGFRARSTVSAALRVLPAGRPGPEQPHRRRTPRHPA